jgi:hypothetical protein
MIVLVNRSICIVTLPLTNNLASIFLSRAIAFSSVKSMGNKRRSDTSKCAFVWWCHDSLAQLLSARRGRGSGGRWLIEGAWQLKYRRQFISHNSHANFNMCSKRHCMITALLCSIFSFRTANLWLPRLSLQKRWIDTRKEKDEIACLGVPLKTLFSFERESFG